MNEKITLSGVPETMLQTLYARAKETCTRGAIRDEKAAALVERIDYDFALADKDAAMHSGAQCEKPPSAARDRKSVISLKPS